MLPSPPSERSFTTRQSEPGYLVPCDEVVGRFQEVCRVTKLALDWDSRAMQDVTEDLKLLLGNKNLPTPAEPETPESFFAGLRQILSQVKTQITSLCFKSRGKYTEAECRKGVGVALEKLGNEIWRRLTGYLHNDYNAHLYTAVSTFIDLQQKSVSIRNQLLKAQTGFEDFLKQCFSHTQGSESYMNSPLYSPRQTVNSSYISDTVESESVAGEMVTYSEKLVGTLQKLTQSGRRENLNPSNRKEVDRLLRDIAKAVRANREETGKITKEIHDQRLERYIVSLRSKAIALIKDMEAAANLPTSQDIISGLQQDIIRLESVIVSQAEEIRCLKASLYEPNGETSFQSTMLTEMQELKGMMATTMRRNSEDVDLNRALALLRASAPGLKAENEAELIEKYCDQTENLKSKVNALMTKLALNDVSVTSLESIGDTVLQLRRDLSSLASSKDSLDAKFREQRNHYELEIEYLERRLKDQETKEKPLTAVLSVPDSPTMRLETVSSLDDGMFLTDDRSRMIGNLQEALHKSAVELLTYRQLYGNLPEETHPQGQTLNGYYEDEDALGLELGISLELLKGRKQDILNTLEGLLEELQSMNGMKRKAKKEVLSRMMTTVKDVTTGYVHEFAQLRKLEGDLNRMESIVKTQKASVHFREE